MPNKLLILLAIGTPLTASAVPLELVHQGRLMDASGAALNGSHDLHIAIYDDPAGAVPAWEDTFTTGFDTLSTWAGSRRIRRAATASGSNTSRASACSRPGTPAAET